ncbi:3-hexulose-6-phosphate synthase [Planococcus sp. 1R117A]|uniref:3-hexulose-6-phosphate synthase n=1 Tax=Planococcus sp. 1R117A TaxID=3447020 RepID=UPI003EDBAA35
MNIQLALDRLTKEECYQIVDETFEFIDWIEVGTGVIKEYGMAIVKEMKAAYPSKVLVADMKTCDAGRYEAEQAFKAGADVITVMGFANNQTILDALQVAHNYDKEVMIDLLEIKNPERVKEIAGLGATLFCLHIGKDRQSQGEGAGKEGLEIFSDLLSIKIAIAGGIDNEVIRNIKNSRIEAAIVGSAITKSEDPKKAAQQIREAGEI